MFIVLGFRRFHKSMHFFLSFQRNVIFTADHSFSVLRGHRVRIRLARLTRCLDGEAEAPATPGHGEGRREGRRGGAHGRAPASCTRAAAVALSRSEPCLCCTSVLAGGATSPALWSGTRSSPNSMAQQTSHARSARRHTSFLWVRNGPRP